MGHSKHHASTVPIGLNPASGAITSNFHVVFDDWFATVFSTVEQLPDLNSVEWKAIFGDSEYQYPWDNNPIGNVGTAPYDPPLSMDSFDITDSRYQPAPPPAGPPQQREQPQQRETSPEPPPSNDDDLPKLIPRVSPANRSDEDDDGPPPLVRRSDLLDDRGGQPSTPHCRTPLPSIRLGLRPLSRGRDQLYNSMLRPNLSSRSQQLQEPVSNVSSELWVATATLAKPNKKHQQAEPVVPHNVSDTLPPWTMSHSRRL
jgi:hypothetical protein